MNDEDEEKRRKWCLLIIVALLIAFLAFSLAQNAQNTADINNIFAPVPNNTNLAPDFSGIDPTVPFGTGERIQNVTYNATNYSLDLHVFAHAMSVSDTASVKVYIDGVLVSPRSGRPLAVAETAYRGVDITIPKNSSYLVNITNYHHYEWREYPILAGKNGTISLTQTFITNLTNSFNKTYDLTTKAFDANYSAQTFPNSSINDTVLRNYTVKTAINNIQRDISLASGTQTVSGLAFKPSSVDFVSNIDNAPQMSIGFDNGGAHVVSVYTPSLDGINGHYHLYTAGSILILIDSTNYYSGQISSFTDDGFVISWTKTGNPTGTANVAFNAHK